MTDAPTAGRRLFLALLKQEGVRVMFGNPGTTELPLMDALAGEDEIRYVLALQESLVMAMADGYARASGTLGVANVHVAPGLGNAMGMLFDAHKAGSPVLLTAGQQAQGFGITEPNLYAELPPMAQPFVKYAVEVRRAEDLPRLLHRAAKTALAPPMGPVFVSLPVDVMNAEAPGDLATPSRVAPRITADAAEIAKAARLLAVAQNPAIIAGDCVAQSGAAAELVALAEALGAPVWLEGEPTTLPFPPAHPQFRGPITRLGRWIHDMLAPHDLVLSVGADMFTLSLPPEIAPLPPGIKVVQLDTNPWELAKNFPADAALFGDPLATLPLLTEALEAALGRDGIARARARRVRVGEVAAAELSRLTAQAEALADRTPIAPLALMKALGDTLPPEAVVVDESISSGAGMFHFLRHAPPGSLFGNRGGGIGWGLPAAVGVQLALPKRPVVAVVGDGSAMYSIQALWTAAHEKLPITFVILNNRSYRILKQRLSATKGTAAQRGRYVGMELSDPAIDFCGLAQSMGVAAVRVETIADFTAALKRGLAGPGPLLIEAATDPTFQPL
ncbi:MAG: thiamine pyrophosphate-binding protein [Acetobacteraceae bacterium]|nr:thiamine pyrophosphate-binding protein [Acetobacteraceae bacterium]